MTERRFLNPLSSGLDRIGELFQRMANMENYLSRHGNSKKIPFDPDPEFGGVNWTKGNGFLSGTVQYVGDAWANVEIVMAWGTTSVSPAGDLGLALPFAPPSTSDNSAWVPGGGAMIIDGGVNRGWYPAVYSWDVNRLVVLRGPMGSQGVANVSNTAPIAFGSTDGLHIVGTYPRA